jgi:type II secretion system protein J
MILLRNNQARSSLQGFTLVEVLMATLSFAVILTALNTTFYAAMRLRSRATQNVENIIPMNQAAAIIKRDLCGILPTNTLAGPLTAQVRGTVNNLSGYLEFYSTSGMDNDYQYWGEVQKIAYYLANPESANQAQGLDLVRAITRNMLPVTTEDIEETPLLSGIEALEFAFYDGTTWQNSWDSTTAATPLPQAIRISMQLAGQDYRFKANEPLEFIVPVVIQARTNQSSSSQTTSSGAGGSSGGGGTGAPAAPNTGVNTGGGNRPSGGGR